MPENITEAFTELERSVYAALETYSNVHRGSGHFSMVSTHLFEQARDIVIKHLGLNQGKYVVIFCTPRRAEILKNQLNPERYKFITSQDTGLPIGIRALVVDRKALPGGAPFQTGGGTARLVSPAWVIWADTPDRFEAGTPAIMNVIAFAKALQLTGHFGHKAFRNETVKKLTAAEILYNDEPEKYSGQKLLDEIRQTMTGRGVLVPTAEGPKPFINLDNGASTPTFAPVWKAVCQTWCQSPQVQLEIIHEVRSICAGFLGAPPDVYDVIFTSNTTEAINLAAESLGGESEQDTEPVILNTLLEHNSNDLPWRMFPRLSLIRLPVDEEGFVDLGELEILLSAYNEKGQYGKKRIRIMAVSGASNVLGVFNNLAEISRIVHRYGARLLVDAAQLIAHRKVEMESCGIDYLVFSAHKVYAPFGCGVLAVRKGLLHFSPAEWELIRSSGEENAAGIAALGKALILLQRIGLDLIREEEQALTRRTLIGLKQIPGLRILGMKDPDSPRFAQKGGVIVFNLKGALPNTVAKRLAEYGGIGVRYGCHCAHLLVKHILHVPPLLAQFQGLLLTLFPGITLPGVVRISIGLGNTEADIDKLIQTLGKIASKTPTLVYTHTDARDKGTTQLSRKELQQQMSGFVGAVAQKVYTFKTRD